MKNLSKISRAIFVFVVSAGFLFSCNDDDDTKGTVDPDTIAAADLIAHFSFDREPAGGAAVAGSDEQIRFVRKVGAGSFVTGQRGMAYQGSAEQAFLEYDVMPGSTFSKLDEFTITCWLKTPATTAGVAKIFGLNGGDSLMGSMALIQESSAGGDSVDLKLFLFDSTEPATNDQEIRKSNKEFLNDKWFHLAALYRNSSSTMEFYANGIKVYSQEMYAGPVPESGPQTLLGAIYLGDDMSKIFFGAWPQQVEGTAGSWMTYFTGTIDEFRIYDKALSDQELTDLYEAELSQTTP